MSSLSYARPNDIEKHDRKWPDQQITRSPIWNAVDLRDGNQALADPMNPKQKREYFRLLCDMGFKEIEVGFPSASADDFNFCRELIEQEMIPDDVTISVLTQARPHLIEKTIESLRGVRRGIVHFYIATSELHYRFVFNLERQQLIDTARQATQQIRDGAATLEGSDIRLEFSPEEFTDTDLDLAVEICEAVVDTWDPADGEQVILNLPATVERRMPNEYADMIEAFRERLQAPEKSCISVHVHNDMGMGVASTMQSLMAGADRVEGTLFGHGERTGNVDLVTVALNLQYLGIDTGLDFSKLDEIRQTVERVTSMPVHARHPYAGELVFTAFSGSHQDAIHKGLARRDELVDHFGAWKVPYLHLDPGTLGRRFERFIRINSQSGKGGIAHVLERDHRVKMPRWVQIEFAKHVQQVADSSSRELTSEELWKLFQEAYVRPDEPIKLLNYWPRPSDEDPQIIEGELHVIYHGERHELSDTGNGPVSAFVHAVRRLIAVPEFNLVDYEEETRGRSADAEAVCFVRLQVKREEASQIGVGFGSNIDQAAVRAVLSGLNAILANRE